MIIGKLFFPEQDDVTEILAVFGVYAVGFLMRPLGGIVFGLLGDRIGRRRLLVIVILSAGAATMAIGLLPTYQQIGILAPILLLACRMVQGFSAAGETVTSNAFMGEHAPAEKRGLYVGFNYSFTTVPSVVAALFVLLLMNALGPDMYESWGWRIAFLVAGPIALIGFYIRKNVDESPAFEAAKEAQEMARSQNLEQKETSSRLAVVHTLALAALSSLMFYLFSGYMVVYLKSSAGVEQGQALLTNGIALFIAFVFFWIGGALSDRFGRRPVLFSVISAIIVLYLPAFWLAGHGTLWSILAGQLIIGITGGIFWGVFGVTILELFPTRNRLSGAMISYNMSYTVFGGTAPLVATWLIAQTGLLIAPGIYTVGVAILVLIILIALKMPETAATSMLHDEDRVPAP